VAHTGSRWDTENFPPPCPICSNSRSRLFSLQTYFKEYIGGSLVCQQQGLILTLHDRSTLSFPWLPSSKLPFMLTTKLFEEMKRQDKEAHHLMLDRSTFSVSPLPNLLDLSNTNLSSSQKRNYYCGINVLGMHPSSIFNKYLPCHETGHTKY
jgi:hypothetical protein